MSQHDEQSHSPHPQRHADAESAPIDVAEPVRDGVPSRDEYGHFPLPTGDYVAGVRTDDTYVDPANQGAGIREGEVWTKAFEDDLARAMGETPNTRPEVPRAVPPASVGKADPFEAVTRYERSSVPKVGTGSAQQPDAAGSGEQPANTLPEARQSESDEVMREGGSLHEVPPSQLADLSDERRQWADERRQWADERRQWADERRQWAYERASLLKRLFDEK